MADPASLPERGCSGGLHLDFPKVGHDLKCWLLKERYTRIFFKNHGKLIAVRHVS